MVDLVRYDAAEIGTLYQHDDRSLAEKYGNQIAPFFRVEISDQSDQVLFSAESSVHEGSYDLEGLIISEVTWDENDCQASAMTLKVQNPDLRLHDSRLFAEGNSVDLWMGYDGFTPDYMGRAIITELEPEFPSSGIPAINVTLYDIAYFMMEEARAEIVPEGTAWFERHTQTNSQSTQRQQRVGGTHVAGTPEERDQRNRQGTVSGQPPAPSVTVAGTQQPASLDLGNRPARSVVLDEPSSSSNVGNTARTTNWRQARIPRRRRNSGKVWRELRDDEIVEKIFWSYGVVPYTEATNQRARGTNRTVENELTEINSSHISNDPGEQARRLQREEELGLTRRTPGQTVADDLPELNLQGLETIEARLFAQTTTSQRQERTGGRRVVQKSGTSDWEFIKKLAKAHGHIVFVFFHYESKRWIGYWGPPQNVPQDVAYTFQYNAGDASSLGKVKPRISMRGQKTEIDLSFVDPRSGREQRLRVSMDSVNPYSPEFRGPDGPATIPEPLGNGPEVTLTIHGQRVQTIANRPFTDMDDARRWLMAFWYRHATDFCQIEGDTIIGLPEMRARQKHSIDGIGRVSGNFFITKSTHSMKSRSIYTSTFSGYRVVDFMEAPVTPDSNLLTVDSNALGEMVPEV